MSMAGRTALGQQPFIVYYYILYLAHDNNGRGSVDVIDEDKIAQGHLDIIKQYLHFF